MKNQTHQTIAEVFTWHYEALRQWHPDMCSPETWPDAVRYFVKQRLGGPERNRVTLDYCPNQLEDQAFEFRDGSYFVPPDEIFEDQDSYEDGLQMRALRAEMYRLQRQIESLPFEPSVRRVFSRSSDLLRDIEHVDCLGDKEAENTAKILIEILRRNIITCFRKGNCHVKTSKDLLYTVKKAHSIFPKWPEAVANSLQIAIVLWLARELTSVRQRRRQRRKRSCVTITTAELL